MHLLHLALFAIQLFSLWSIITSRAFCITHFDHFTRRIEPFQLTRISQSFCFNCLHSFSTEILTLCTHRTPHSLQIVLSWFYSLPRGGFCRSFHVFLREHYSISLSVSLSVSLYLSISLSISLCLFLSLSLYLSLFLSIYLNYFIYLSIHLSIYVFFSPSIFHFISHFLTLSLKHTHTHFHNESKITETFQSYLRITTICIMATQIGVEN